MMTLTKVFTFDAGHRLSDYEGKCKRLHGHTYTVEISVTGYLNDLGMILDFGELKDIFKRTVDAKFDHKMILKKDDPINIAISKALPETDESICWFDHNPTAENICEYIFVMLKEELLKLAPSTLVEVKGVRLYETPTSYAEIKV